DGHPTHRTPRAHGPLAGLRTQRPRPDCPLLDRCRIRTTTLDWTRPAHPRSDTRRNDVGPRRVLSAWWLGMMLPSSGPGRRGWPRRTVFASADIGSRYSRQRDTSAVSRARLRSGIARSISARTSLRAVTAPLWRCGSDTAV